MNGESLRIRSFRDDRGHYTAWPLLNVHTKIYIVTVVFDRDSNKNSENVEKYGISFEQAQEVFLDPLHLSILAERFSYFEERWITVGTNATGEVIVVAHQYFVEEPEERIRIISARSATPKEMLFFI